MPKITVKGQTVQTGECPQTNGHMEATKRIIARATRSIIRKVTNRNDESDGDNSGTGHYSSTVWQQSNERWHQRLGQHVELGPQSFRDIATTMKTHVNKHNDRKSKNESSRSK